MAASPAGGMSPSTTHFDPMSSGSPAAVAPRRANNSNITPFRVYARVRPFIQTELEGASSENLRSCVEMVENKTILLNPAEDFAPKAEYAFDDSFWSMQAG